MAPPDDATLRAERALRESMDVATLRRRVAELEAALVEERAISIYLREPANYYWCDEVARVHTFYRSKARAELVAEGLLAGQAGGGRRGEGGGG